MTDTPINLTPTSVNLPGPNQTQVVKLTPNMLIEYNFDVADVTFSHNGSDLVLNAQNGGTLVFEGFLDLAHDGGLPVFQLISGEQVPGEVYLFAFENVNQNESETAANAAQTGSGAGVYTDDDGNLYRGLTGLDGQDIQARDDSRLLFVRNIQDQPEIQFGDSNNPPTINGHLSLQMAEDGYNAETGTASPLIIHDTDILSLVSDPDPGSYVAVTDLSVSGGTLTQIAAGVWSYMPDQDFNGEVSVNFSVSDGTYTVQGSGAIDITPVEDAAVISGTNAVTINEDDGSISGVLTVTDADIEDNPHFIPADNIQGDYGSLTIDADGNWTYTPNEAAQALGDGDHKTDTFTVTATDGTETVTETITVTVNGANDAPELTFEATDTTTNYVQNGSFEDIPIADGDWGHNQAPEGWTKVEGDRWEVMSGDRFGIEDGADGRNVVDMGVGHGQAMVIAQDVSLPEAGEYVISLEGFDRGANRGEADSGDIVVYWNGEEVGRFNPGTESWETATFTVNVADGETNGTLTIESSNADDYGNVIDNVSMHSVNTGDNVPVLVPEDTDLGTVVATAVGSDVDSTGLTYSIVEDGTPFTIDANTGVITLAAGLNYEDSTSYTINVSVSDGDLTTTKELVINVGDVNETPEVSAAMTLAGMDEDGQPIVITEAQLLANASDPDSDTMHVTDLTLADGSGTLTDNGDHTWTFTPSHNWNGDVQLTYSVSDGELSTPATANFQVEAVNDGPTLEFASTVGSENLIHNGSFEEGITIAEGDWANGQAPEGWTRVEGDRWEVMSGDRFGINGASDGDNVIDTGVGNNEALVISQVVNGLSEGEYVINLDLFDRGDNWEGEDSGNIDVLWNGEVVATINPGDTAWETGSILVTVGEGETSGTLTLVSHDADSYGNVIDNISMHSVTPTAGDTVVVAEDAAAGSVIATAVGSDVDSTDLTYSIVDNNSPFSINSETGEISLTGNLDYETTTGYTVTVRVDDGDGGYTTEDLTINVGNVNDNAPVAGDVTFTTNEDTPLTITAADILAQTSDADGDARELTSLTINGHSVDVSDGSWTFTPDANFNGSVDISYTVSDGEHSVNGSGTVTVDPVNDAPILAADSFTVNEDSGHTILDVLANDSDADNDKLTLTGVGDVVDGDGNVVGTATIVDNEVQFTPNDNFNGTATFSYEASDGTVTQTQTATITVDPVNDAPTLDLDGGSHMQVSFVSESATLNNVVGAYIVDDEGHASDPQILVYNQNAGIDPGTVLTTLAEGQHYEFFIMSDGASKYPGLTDSDLSFSVEDGKLVLNVDGSPSTASVFFSDSNNDPDNLEGGHFHITENPDGSTTIAMEDIWNGGDHDFSDVVLHIQPVDGADGTGYTATFVENTSGVHIASAGISITDVEGAIDHATITIDNPQDGDQLNLGNLPDGITATTITDAETGAITGITLTATDGAGSPADFESAIQSITFSNGLDNFDTSARTVAVTVTDNGGLSASAETTIDMVGVNDRPVTVGDQFTIAEDQSTTFTFDQLLGNDSDAETPNSELRIITVGTSDDTHGTVVIDQDARTVTFTPDADYNGSANFTYGVQDANGGYSTATVDLTITPVNDAPVLAADSFTVSEDSGHTMLDVLANDTDVDGNTLTLTGVGDVVDGAGNVVGTATIVDNEVQFTPNDNFNGTATFSYEASDGTVTQTQTATITVDPVNDAPVLAADSFTVSEDSGHTMLDVLANDTDVDGNPLTLTGVGDVVDSAGNVVGTATIVDNEVQFTPNDNFNGTATFSYEASDGTVTQTQTATITVDPVNDAPVLAADSFTVSEDSGHTMLDVLANDSDVDGTPLTLTGVGDVVDSTGNVVGTATIVDNEVQFTPNDNFNGTATFSYEASDGTVTQTQTATITVDPVNDAPVLAADSFTVSEDSGHTMLDVLANDTDVDGNTLTLTGVGDVVDGAGNVVGTATIVDNEVQFTPNDNFNGTATFSYEASDGTVTQTQTATITVDPVNDAPVLAADSFTVSEDSGHTMLDVLANDTDVDGNTLTLTGVSDVVDSAGNVVGTATIVDNEVQFTPNDNFNGTATFSYEASDGTVTQTQTATITVDPVNDAPVLAADSFTVSEDSGHTMLDVLANDSDVDGNPLTLTGVGAVVDSAGNVVGTATIVDNEVQFTPNDNFNGTATFSYEASDGTVTQTQTATITVDPVNDAPVLAADSFTVSEDSGHTMLDVLANDTDVDGNPLTLTGVGDVVDGAGNVVGTATIVDNEVQFTPNDNFNGTATFSYEASDGTVTQTQTATITVDPVNDAPVLAADSFTVSEDSGHTMLDVLANDTDVDGNPLTLTGVSDVVDSAGNVVGTATIVDNEVQFTPNDNFNGTATFSYEASDGTVTQTQTATITVDPVNDAPVLAADSFTVSEDSGHTMLDVLANDTDVDGNPLTLTGVGDVVNSAGEIVGTATIVDNEVQFTPNDNFNGTATFSYEASDGTVTQTQTATITVDPVNDAPVLAADSFTVSEDSGHTMLDVLANDTDVDGNTLTLTGVGDVVNSAGEIVGTATIVDNEVQFTPNDNFNGTATFSYEASDGTVTQTQTATITVDPVNDAPVLAADSFTVSEDSGHTMLDVLANDTDVDGNTLTLTGVGAVVDSAGNVVGTATIVDNEVQFTPNDNFNGTATFSYEASDGTVTQTQTATITVDPVNDAPVLAADSFTVSEDSGHTMLDVLANDSDVDGNPLTLTGVSDVVDSAGNVVGTATIVDNEVQFTPNDNFNGTATFSYEASDGTVTQTQTATITVDPVNDAPVLAADSFTVSEDSGHTMLDVLANDTDVDGNPLTLTGVGDVVNSAGEIVGTATIVDNEVQFTPNDNFNGTATFSYEASDGTVTQTQTATITVDPVNDAPVLAADSFTVSEDSGHTMLDVLANDTDVDGNTLTLTGVGDVVNSAGEIVGTATIVDNEVQFTPNDNFNGTATFSYEASDGTVTQTQTATITVDPVNDAPVLAADSFTVSEDSGHTMLDVLANDTDVDGNTLTLTGVGAVVDSAGNVVGTATIVDNEVQFTPNDNFNGTATFSYEASDGTVTQTQTATITVDPVNDAPVLAADSFTVSEDSGHTMLDVLANDSDVDGNPLTLTGVGAVVDSAGNVVGTATIVDNEVQFTPNDNFNGTATFSYEASDGTVTQTQTATITVDPVNDAPVLAADSFTVSEDSGHTMLDVLANDTDVDGNTLTLTGVSDVVDSAGNVVGTATIVDNEVQFTPNDNFNGTATFSYEASDGTVTQTQTATITVDPVNDAPVLAADSFTVSEDSGHTMLDVLANDTDVDGNTLTLTGVSDVVDSAGNVVGTATIVDNEVQFTPNDNFNGTATFSYEASDGTVTQTQTATITVDPVNDAPVLAADSFTVSEDSGHTMLDVLANDTDVDGNPLTLTGVGDVVNSAGEIVGTATIVDNEVQFTPNDNFNGTATFSYEASDGTVTQTQTATITVDPVNDAPVLAADSFTVSEDSGHTMLDVLANDTDVDGNTLTLTGVGDVVNSAGEIVGTATIVDNEVQFTPNDNFNGTATFSYEASDGTVTQTQTATITVDPVNDAPVLAADSFTVSEDSGHTMLDVLANDTDVDGNTLTLTGVGDVVDGAGNVVGTATIVDNEVQFTPNDNFNGTATFSYEASDGTETQTQTATITVDPVNDAPVLAADSFTVSEDSGHTMLDVLANDTDVDGNTLTLTGVGDVVDSAGNVVGTATIVDNEVQFTPNDNFNGTATFSYEASDGTVTQTQTATITVDPVNDAPVLAADSFTVSEDSGHTMLDVLANDTDVDGNPLTLTGVGDVVDSAGNVVGTATIVDNEVQFTPNDNFNGTATFSYEASDGTVTQTQTATITVDPVNDAPVLAADSFTVSEDSGHTMLDVLANDTDVDGNTLTLTGVSDVVDSAGNVVGTATIVDNEVQFTPNDNFNGTATFSYEASDGTVTQTQTATITVDPVNDAPVLAADSFTVSEDSGHTMLDVLANDTDVDGNPLTLTGVGDVVDGAGNVVGTATIVDNEVQFTPNDNFNGTATFSYEASDGTVTQTQTATITVDPVNDAPVLAADSFTVSEDSGHTMLDVLANDTDVDGNPLTLTGVGDVVDGAGNVVGTATIVDNEVQFTPNDNFNGTATFSYEASDGTVTQTQTATVTVIDTNENPVAGDDNLGSGAVESETISVTTGATISDVQQVAQSWADNGVTIRAMTGYADREDLSKDNEWNASTLSSKNVAFSEAGEHYTYSGFGVNAQNGRDGGEIDTLKGQSGRTEFIDMTFDDKQMSSVTITLHALFDGTQSQFDGNDIEKALVIAYDANGHQIGQVEVNGTANGIVNITLDASTLGSSTPIAEVTVSPVDNNANSSSHNSDFLLAAVTGETVAQVGTFLEDHPVDIDPATLLGNDTDADGDPLSITNVGNATHGEVTIDEHGHIIFTPAEDYNGPASFTYTVSDGHGGEDTATVTLNITAVADVAGIDGDITGSVKEDTEVTADHELTTQGQLTIDDPDAGEDHFLADTLSGGDHHGTLVIDESGHWTYTADNQSEAVQQLGAGQSLTDTFTVTSADHTEQTITVTINGTNDNPIVGNDHFTVVLEEPTTVTGGDTVSVAVGHGSLNSVRNAWEGEGITVTGHHGYIAADNTVHVSDTAQLTLYGQGGFGIAGGDHGHEVDYNGHELIALSFAGNGMTNVSLDLSYFYSGEGEIGKVFAYDTDGNLLGAVDITASSHGGQFSVDISASDLGGTAIGSIQIVPTDDGNGWDNSDFALRGVSGTVAVVETGEVDAGSLIMADDGTVTIAAADLLANDHDIDLNDPNLTITAVGDAEGGTVGFDANHNVVFDPADGFSGQASFTYTVSDGHGGHSTATVTLDIPMGYTAPEAGDVALHAVEDVPLTISEDDILSHVTDLDGDDLTITGLSVSDGTLTDNGNGTWTFTPDADFNGNLDLHYSVTDGTTEVQGTGSIDVGAVNDAPVLSMDAATTNYSTSYSMGHDAVSIAGDVSITDVDSTHLNHVVITLENALDGDSLNADSISGGLFVEINEDHTVITLSGENASLADYENAIKSITFSTTSDVEADRTITVQAQDAEGSQSELSNIGTTTVSVTEDAPMVVDDVYSQEVVFDGANATYNNVIGVYTVNEAGEPSDPEIILFNANKATQSEVLKTFAQDAEIRFFLISDGANKNLDLNADLYFVKDNGHWVLAFNSENGPTQLVQFDNANFNGEGVEASFHSWQTDLDGITMANGQNVQIGVDDQTRGPNNSTGDEQDPHPYWTDHNGDDDDDFDDVKLTVQTKLDGSFTGGSADDDIAGQAGSDTIYGGAGNDTIYGGNRNGYDWSDNELYGGAGNDLIVGGSASDTIYGGEGNDTIYGDYANNQSGWGDDSIYGGTGNDLLVGGAGHDTIYGGEGNDTIYGDHSNNNISYGDDHLYGGDGNDLIIGGVGHDTIDGGAGNDTIYGDHMEARTDHGDDHITGGDGNDLIIGGVGHDVIDGGTGNDTIYGDHYSLTAHTGNDFINGGDGNDLIVGGAGSDTLEGGSGNDTIFADYINGPGHTYDHNILVGGDGDDLLIGGAGNDSIDGGAGNDTIYASMGDDTVYTGDGSDTIFIDSSVLSGGDHTLTISDFDAAHDAISLDSGLHIEPVLQGDSQDISQLIVTNDTGGHLTINLDGATPVAFDMDANVVEPDTHSEHLIQMLIDADHKSDF
ncbi:tandem-95 repeat protein [Pseudodesulfovibrio sp.]|uniref:tandem-95 repeat protein n=1 Tax=unclassified Pseudodesulfovibrio TaxID=2661612 RepID=UPI003B006968